MKLNSPLLLLALPLWLASCTSSIDLIGERALESDEFYLSGGEPHVGMTPSKRPANSNCWTSTTSTWRRLRQSPADKPGFRGHTRSQLWNRYTRGWNTGFNSGFGTGFGYSAYNSFGFSGTRMDSFGSPVTAPSTSPTA